VPPNRWAALAAVVGGSALLVGAHQPWMSFFAGLKPYRGTIGYTGRLLFAGGIVAILGGIVLFVRGDRRLRIAVGAVGGVAAAYAAYLAVRLQQALTHLAAHDAMLIPRRGPGLYVALAGALVVALALIPRRRAATGGPDGARQASWTGAWETASGGPVPG